ncbi:wax ester/triacylglycerol synthase family O-acyltransferase [Massilia sp. CF038]|uniref:wax ester/triacylglycerol synthase family O-acyltransferase n=1 Tax=Massilia sp. CF038 TaxID=1881045 RepID=UPI00090F2113|nr:wax ester/triacylglycerol synthase family O-acyltransferase [Massilia sp. CF038]SHH22093.1 Diacylglycerol O-acyltransferase [Massilia sp. CF038]
MLSKALSGLSRRKMSTVDTAWLRMDSEGNLMMIVGVSMLSKPVSVAGLRQALESRFLVYSRFRSRVVNDLSGAWWQEQEVDLDDHVIHTALPSNKNNTSNKPALQALVGTLSQQPLNPEKPLWQMHLVDNCMGEDGKLRQALIIRIHHCIADGVALVGVFMSMFDKSVDEKDHSPTPRAAAAAEENPWEQIMLPVTAASVKAIDLSSSMFIKSLTMMTDLDKLPGQLSTLGHTAGQLAIDAVKLTTMDEDSHTRLKGKPNGKKHVSWSEPLPLAEVKAISKAFGCSINDVLMASVAGALRAYLRSKGDAVESDCDVRVMVPVNLRKASRQQKLGNAFGLVPLVLPVGLENPVARLFEVRHRMNELKGSYTALVAMSVLGVLGATPKQVQTEIQNYFARKATAVMSNVPGPQQPLFIAGSQLDQCMFWVPQSGDIGIGVSILSYNGGVQFGIVTDDALVQDPDNIIKRFAPEFEKLVMLALMGDWE